MTTATIDRPVRPREMGRIEAEAITQTIKDNFDSLGSMLLQARDRKAYKALGYRAFETYCKSEFGKSVSAAYRLIEDAKTLANLEAEISKQYDEPITLKIPSSQLRPLKELPEMGDKLKAIDYANKLAGAEGKQQPTKKHLEIAVFEIGGHRSEDFKSAIESLGFTKNTPVEMFKSQRKDRGFVKKVDKLGKVHIELYDGGAVPIPVDAKDLRILTEGEKPAIPANDNTANKGDRVKIFAKGLGGKTGEIYIWKMGKHAMVLIDGQSSPTDIAYAELELIRDKETEAINVEVTQDSQWRDLKWTDGENHYYYFARENKIYNTAWPSNITISPNIHCEGPIEFLGDWMKKFATNIVKSLSNCDIEALQAENQKLREQLAEAEEAIKSMCEIIKAPADFPVENPPENPSPGETTTPADFLVESTSEPSHIPAPQIDDWVTLLQFFGFHKIFFSNNLGEFIETYRNWEIYFESPNTGITAINISHLDKGSFSCCIEHIEDRLNGSEEILKWTKNVINHLEDFCPGQLSLNLNTENEFFPQEMINRVEIERENLFDKIKNFRTNKGKTKREKEQNAKKDIEALRRSLSELDSFEKLRIGQVVWQKNNPEVTGEITGFTFTTGGMPHIFVRWKSEYENESSVISTEIVSGILVSLPGL